MRMLALLALLLLPLSAVAEERISARFLYDEDWPVACADFGLYSSFTIQVTIHEPECATLDGFEFDLVDSAEAFFSLAELPADGVNRGSQTHLDVEFAEPFAVTDGTELARLECVLFDTGVHCLEITGGPDPTVPGDLPVIHPTGEEPRQVAPWGLRDRWFIQLGGGCGLLPGYQYYCVDLLPNETRTWGALKALY